MKFDETFWRSAKSTLLLNPRFPEKLKESLHKAVEQQSLSGTVWLKSSGTESGRRGHKLVALKKEAILCAAQSVNRFFNITDRDVWLNPLPLFHIGGLSIQARVYLARALTCALPEWSPGAFHQAAEKSSVTVTSLVPTQVYDLVEQGFRAPSSLRLVIVGGGPLNKSLYFRGRELGWPLIPSYGMTETSALMAAAEPASLDTMEFPDAKLLPHVDLIRRSEGHEARSEALFSGFLWVQESGEWEWAGRPTPFVLDDRIELENRNLRVLGRDTELVKILGETVNLWRLKETLQVKIPANIVLVSSPEPRRGHRLHLFVEAEPFDLSVDELNKTLMPYEALSDVNFLPRFPRTELGKVNLSEISKRVIS